MESRTLVIGPTVVDRTYVVPEALQEDSSILAVEYFEMIGGTGYCFASALRKLFSPDDERNRRVSLFSIVGSDFPIKLVEESGIDYSLIQVNESRLCDHATIVVENDRKTIVSYKRLLDNLDLSRLSKILRNFDSFVLSSLLPAQVRDVFESLPKKGKVLFAPNRNLTKNSEFWSDFCHAIDYLSLSIHEWDNLDSSVKSKLIDNVPLVTVTKGKLGSVAYINGEMFQVNPVDWELPVLDSNGAGEQFASVVYHEVFLKDCIVDYDSVQCVLELASAAASYVIRKKGDYFVSRSELERISTALTDRQGTTKSNNGPDRP